MVKQTLTFNEVWESVETNHDWISFMAKHHADTLKVQRVMKNDGCNYLYRLAHITFG